METSSHLETKNRYAICVGINRYHAQDQILPLRFAEQDAKDVHALLLAHGFNKEHCRLLLGEEATWEAIHQALTTLLLTEARKDDLVIFYFAGHGVPISINDEDEDEEQEPQSDVFLCSTNFDLQKMVDERGAWLGYPLRMQKLRTDIFELAASRKVLFIFDSCHSGDFFGKHYRPRTSENLAMRYIEQPFGKNSRGRLVLSSCLPHQTSRESKQLGHGLFTYHLLEALTGRVEQAIRHDGWVTVGSLFDYLADQLPKNQRPVKSGVEHDAFRLLQYSMPTDKSPQASPLTLGDAQQKYYERNARLQALLADHSGFLRTRLESFVGRKQELHEIRTQIAKMQPTGGYITITGQAGQGKSSIIAKLVQEYDPEKVAYHFIPFRPGPDHQVGLLRNLMARLILKYDMPELYVVSESRPALRDYFPHVLQEVARRGGQEVIFVDGLDQLEEDATGVRDLTFLPNGSDQPPTGIVFVLGTRPNDTLRPLELLKPHYAYVLPNLSREDFDLILQHRGVTLERGLVNRFYHTMQENALYLDLVAQELAKPGTGSAEEIIKRIAADPDNLFSLSLEHLKRSPLEWREVLKPTLGLLLAAREPLSGLNIRHILHLEHDLLSDGLRRLGGLVSYDGMGRYTLFHLKFYDYLREDRNKAAKEYIFAQDEEENWHQRLAEWCEQGGIQQIWQDMPHHPVEQGRRIYARKHYITHLYYAHAWQKLFDILDKGNYGKEKVKYDPTNTRTFILDLDWGCQAATAKEWNLQESVQHLPHLWRYTLLRTSLISRAEQYPEEAFLEMLVSGKEDRAIGFAELITNSERKANLLLLIAQYLLERPNRKAKSLQTFIRVEEVISEIKSKEKRSELFYKLAITLLQAQVWDKVQFAINLIETSELQEIAFQRLAEALAQDQRWEQTKSVLALIEDEWRQAEVLATLAAELAQAQLKEQAWSVIETITPKRVRVTALRNIANVFVKTQLWSEAERAITAIEHYDEQTTEFQVLAIAMAKAQLWSEAERISNLIENEWRRGEALCDLAISLAQAQLWSEAMRVATQIIHKRERAKAFKALALLQEHNQINNLEDQVPQDEKQQDKMPAYTHQLRAIIVPPEQRWHFKALQELADTLIQAQQWNEAEHIVYSIEDKKEQADLLQKLAIQLAFAGRLHQAQTVISKLMVSQEQVKPLIALGEAFIHSGKLDEAFQVWQEVQKAVSTFESSDKRAEILRELAGVLIKAKQWLHAEKVISSISPDYKQASALRELGQALMQAQQKEQALRIWQQAAKAISFNRQRSEQARALCELGQVLMQAQQKEYAFRIWEQAEKVTNSISNDYERANALCQLGQVLAQAQQKEQALRICQQAELVIDSIEDSTWRAEALCQLGQVLAQAQQKEQALRICQQAREDIKIIKGDFEQVKVLRKLLKTLIQAQEWQQAEEIIRSIQTISIRAEILREMEEALATNNNDEQLLHLVQRWWLQASTRDEALSLLSLANDLVHLQPEISIRFYEAFAWVDTFLEN